MTEHYQAFHGEGSPPDSILRRAEFFPVLSYGGVYVDVGAGHPLIGSNSYHFYKNDWDVRAVEANPYYVKEWEIRNRRCVHAAIADKCLGRKVPFTIIRTNGGDPTHMAAFSALTPHATAAEFTDREVVEVPQRTLNSLFENEWRAVARKVDVLDLDIEWGEMDALKGLDLTRFRPKVLLVEDHGAASGSREYLEARGYVHVLVDSYNHFYKRVEDLK